MLVCCLGDIMLDVLVSTPHGLAPDDDTDARIEVAAGGQAANVAAWAVALGATARVYGPRAQDSAGRLLSETLRDAGVELHGPAVDRSGAVVSLVADGTRSLASDAGTTTWLDEVAPGTWLDGADWLFVSGYALLRAARPERIVATAAAARANGTAIAVDLSSAGMIRSYGADRFSALCASLDPAVVLANDEEWAAVPALAAAVLPGTALVLKHGPRGCTFVVHGSAGHRAPAPGPVVDVTGAGDACAAGFLVGGPDLALATAARCVAQIGGQPGAQPGDRPGDRPHLANGPTSRPC